jgi:hypothetical protein
MYACDPSLLLSQQPDIPTLPLANNLRQRNGLQAPFPSFLPLVLEGFNGAWQP